ncbi:MAG: hypothetical protein ACK55K_01060 [Bacteroidota bacterium]
MQLDILVKGTGSVIKKFKLDGVEKKEPFIADTLSGTHQIEIELNNQPLKRKTINLTSNQFSLPTPRAMVAGNEFVWDSIPGAVSYHVYRNGVFAMSIKNNAYELIPEEAGEYAVAAIDKRGQSSFISEPVQYRPAAVAAQVEIEAFASAAAYSCTQYTGNGFVEISNSVNKEIIISYNAPKDGIYLIDFRYSNGSGPWNTDNKCALRSLYVNKNYVGAVVFPQRGTEEWSNWGYSNSYTITLRKGINQIRLSLENWNVNMNEEINRAMLDHMRIIVK